MHNYYNETLQRNVRILYIGEYTATAENVYLSTVLGSCITVALYDSTRNIGGLNHFMLPESGDNRDHASGILGGAARYGMGAMEFLINELMKLGARREELSAKVFGGGHVLHTVPTQAQSVPEKNIDFAFTWSFTKVIGYFLSYWCTFSIHLCRSGFKGIRKA